MVHRLYNPTPYTPDHTVYPKPHTLDPKPYTPDPKPPKLPNVVPILGFTSSVRLAPATAWECLRSLRDAGPKAGLGPLGFGVFRGFRGLGVLTLTLAPGRGSRFRGLGLRGIGFRGWGLGVWGFRGVREQGGGGYYRDSSLA